jgi:S-formylglutathione hydrolase FrmB
MIRAAGIRLVVGAWVSAAGAVGCTAVPLGAVGSGAGSGSGSRALLIEHGRLEEVRTPAPSLRGSLLGGEAVRRTVVYLPPSYDAGSDRRYPVVYLLHGFDVGPMSWLGVDGFEGMNLALTLDSLIAAGRSAEFIVVMPDARTRFGGAWYANSAATGRWTDFVARDLVSFVDRAYRTIPRAEARGLGGHSMGGYGALRVALWYPGVFGAVHAIASPNLVSTNPFGIEGIEVALAVPDPALLDLASPVARVLWAKAAAFAPDPTQPPFYGSLPWVRVGDRFERQPEAWAAWEQSALVSQLDLRGRSLDGVVLRLEVGRFDPLQTETTGFSEALDTRDITHELQLFNGGHVRGVRRRFETSVFQFFTSALSASSAEHPERP